MTKERALERLRELLWVDPRVVSEDSWVAIAPLMFTHAIIRGTMSFMEIGYDDRWCYHSKEAAQEAMAKWDGVTGEPEGWHRHPSSGRRRDKDGNEWINP